MAIKVRDYAVRLTKNGDERRKVRQLRYEVFVGEEGASATPEQRGLGEEWDRYDGHAEYMAVFHKERIVGTYRIINREAAEKMGGFYTETEFNLAKIKKVGGNIAEMSRACVAREYRDDALVMRMLWMGLGEYVLRNKIKVLFGTASWVGAEPVESAMAISYLYYNRLAPLALRATVLPDKMADGVNPKLSAMRIYPRAFVDEAKAMAEMTPLIKGYLRLGATFGRGVFIDKPFNTYDVFVTLQTKNIGAAYQKKFAGKEDAFAHLGIKPSALKIFGKIVLSPLALVAGLGRLFLSDDEAMDAEIVDDAQ
ncbi:MAG: GNAT family N-acetyltransferase [Rickettsiales bacterium]|jgi:putative hemolysin|nr:GNAT family N-acetyltransferase [Rickettsiales bacterium]